NLSHNIQTMLVTGSECPDCTNATSHSASPGRKVQQLVREPWQKQRSLCFCLDFFVTFFIKKKSKERFFRAPVPMKIGRQAKERKRKWRRIRADRGNKPFNCNYISLNLESSTTCENYNKANDNTNSQTNPSPFYTIRFAIILDKISYQNAN